MRLSLRDGLHLRAVVRDGDRRAGAEVPPLLLVHGFTGSVEAWGEIPARLAETGRRVIAVDLLGHGASDLPPGPSRLSMEAVVGDLANVLDALHVDRAVWVGYSMGGRIALGGAVLRPDRVAALVLESASPGLADAEDRAARRRADEQWARRLEGEGMAAFVDAWLRQPVFQTLAALPAEARERERKRRMGARPVGLARALRGLGTGHQPPFHEDLPRVDRPTLLVTGALDAKFEALAREMVEALPRAVHASVPGAGHTVHLERPDAWLSVVADWLDGAAAGAGGGEA